MKVIVLGGDGFCGWATALHLSRVGHEVVIVDNLSRRAIDVELEVRSLTPIRDLGERVAAWRDCTGATLRTYNLTIGRDYEGLLKLLHTFQPDAVVHFAEQRAAPYSMKSSAHKRYTVSNNLNATNDICTAIIEAGLDTHLIHLGTMGVYGYGTPIPIPEGYLNIRLDTQAGELAQEILYPADPGSVYHMTKTQDQLFFKFYNKNDGLRVTDLHQGIVWGTQTEETSLDPRLINRFDYDGDYGTVLNRFLVQGAIGHSLTVHGSGGQTRAFIHIQDCVRCIRLALENPPPKGERVRIMNQMTETHCIRDLANLVSRLTGTPIERVPNPRVEAEENTLEVRNAHLLGLGLDPIKLEEGLLSEVIEVAGRYRDRIDVSKIYASSAWNAVAAARLNDRQEPA